MTHEETISFAKGSAHTALDQMYDYDSLWHSAVSYRVNVTDTLRDYGIVEYATEALQTFDSEMISIIKNHSVQSVR